MEALDEELSPVLEQLMTLLHGNDDHPDVVWFYHWLIHYERSVEDFIYVLGPLQERLIKNMTIQTSPLVDHNAYNNGDDVSDACKRFHLWDFSSGEPPPPNAIYLVRVAFEALAVRCPVLEGQWETVIEQLFDLFKSYCGATSMVAIYGKASPRFSSWLIRTVSDSYMCPNPVLRLKMLFFYRMLLKLDDSNYEQALDSLLLACASLDKHGDLCLRQIWLNIENCLHIFDDYFLTYDLKIAEKFRLHREIMERIRIHDISQEYAIGLKTVYQPREVNILTVLLKCASEGSRIDYQFYNEEYDKESYSLLSKSIELSSVRLFTILGNFKRTLHEPELINVTAEAIMDVLEALAFIHHIPNPSYDSLLHRWHHILWKSHVKNYYRLMKDFTDGRTINEIPIGREIIRRFSDRICKMRSLITEKFKDTLRYDAPMFYGIVYNDQY